MPADPARLSVARQLLDQLGLSAADLLSDGDHTTTVPTVAEYLPLVMAAAGSGSRRAYGSYWTRMATAWGSRPLTAIAASEIEALQRELTATARCRRNSRNGRYAGEHVIAQPERSSSGPSPMASSMLTKVPRIGSPSPVGCRALAAP